MGKTKAQRQKEYRERLKEKNNEKYLMDARERQKRNYISVKNMGKAEIEKRRAAVRERVRKSRAAAKERIEQAKRIEGTLATTNDNTTLPGNLQTPGTMVVKLDFRQRKKSNSSRKRERLLADRRRKAVEKLQDENKKLKRKTERLYKQLQRKKKKNLTTPFRTTTLSASSTSGSTSESSSFQSQSEATTPRSKVDAEIRDSGVSPSVIPKPIKTSYCSQMPSLKK